MLVCARMAGLAYNPPANNAISGVLLDANHLSVSTKNGFTLQKHTDKSGISVMGDGATIKKKPLFNILASVPHIPSIVLDMHSCANHLARGERRMHSILPVSFYQTCSVLTRSRRRSAFL